MSYEWQYVGEEGKPAFENGSYNIGNTYPDVKFRKGADGVVFIEGGFNSSPQAYGKTVFTLPSGYRPTDGDIYSNYDYTGQPARCIICSDGRVIPYKNIGSFSQVFFVGDTEYPGGVGEQGETGATGDDGATGDTGVKGDKGDRGLQGATGVSGDIVWHYVGAEGQPALSNDWENVQGAENLRFRRDGDGAIIISGSICNPAGTEGKIFTLPIDYRPDVAILIPTLKNTSQMVLLKIESSGDVSIDPVDVDDSLNIHNSFFVGPVEITSRADVGIGKVGIKQSGRVN